MRGRRAGIVVALAGLSLTGCFDGFDYTFDHRPVREDRGPLLAEDVVGGEGSGVTFGADGAEVFYVGRGEEGGPPRLRAVAVADGTARTVDDAAPAPDGALAMSPDGAALYYVRMVSVAPAVYALREAFSGADVALDPPPVPGLLVVSPSGRHLVVARSGDVALLDLRTGEAAPVACAGWGPAAFSPAGDALLCGYDAIAAVPIGGGTAPPVKAIPGAMYAHAVSWSEAGMRAAFFPALVVGDPATGAVLWRRSSSMSPGWNMAFTPDGAALAYVSYECLAGGFLYCSRTETQVRLVELASGAGKLIATTGGVDVQLAVSPDGTALAYTFGNELHLRPTGR